MRFWLIIVVVHAASTVNAQKNVDVDQQFGDVRKVLRDFCFECHSAKRTEGELNLERLRTAEIARADAKPWPAVIVQLQTGEMPPKDHSQPTELQRKHLLDWIQRMLDREARKRAGDPGHIPLHRLSNTEYDNTIRDLTGVDLQPAREFPADGAAGEGFTNAAEALAMSPALMNKYVNSAKDIAKHAVLLPNGFRFSPSATRRDWTDESLAALRQFYRRYAEEGSLPLKPYIAALVDCRDDLQSGATTCEVVADERSLSPKYLQILWDALNQTDAGYPLNRIQTAWKIAEPGAVDHVVSEVSVWFDRLWDFPPIGSYRSDVRQTAKDPTFATSHKMTVDVDLAAGQETVTLHLLATNMANTSAPVIWGNPRFEGDGLPTLALRDYGIYGPRYEADLGQIFASTKDYLAATVDGANDPSLTTPRLAAKHDLNVDWLQRWIDVLQMRPQKNAEDVRLPGREVSPVAWTLLDEPAPNPEFPAIHGWRPKGKNLPIVITNSSDKTESVPGRMLPHSVGVHPMPNEFVAVVWTSPISGKVRLKGKLSHAHPSCGNGVAWWAEFRSSGRCTLVSEGAVELGQETTFENSMLTVEVGDTLTLAIDAKAANHVCDLTQISFTIAETDADSTNRVWDIAADVADTVTDGNPHADEYGNKTVWSFVQGSSKERPTGQTGTPSHSLLVKWKQAAGTAGRETETAQLAQQLQLLLSGQQPDDDDANRDLFDKLVSIDGPLLRDVHISKLKPETKNRPPRGFGLPKALFGVHPSGQPLELNDLALMSGKVRQVALPAALFRGRRFVVEGRLGDHSPNAVVQFQVSTSPPDTVTAWDAAAPIVTETDGSGSERLRLNLAHFRELFPPNVCYPHIIPLDEVVCLKTFHREDEPLRRLFLNEQQTQELEQLWDEHRFVTKFPVVENEYLPLFIGFVTQDQPQSLLDFFEDKRSMFQQRADEFEHEFDTASGQQLKQLADFASRAWRRPLSAAEEQGLTDLYQILRARRVGHDDALRAVLSRVLMSPAFLLHIRDVPNGTAAQPMNDWELACRLSYFLWSSLPDDKLRELATAGELRHPEVLAQQVRRMLNDVRVRSLAVEFGTQWVHVRNFDRFDHKNEIKFPTFDQSLRRDMYEETILFFQDLFQENRSPVSLINADHTFLNESLATHYDIDGVEGTHWRRVDDIRKHGRGGILGLASVLTTQAGASRTSPVLRGNWVVETLLGEQLPNPPPNVPDFPESQLANSELSMREIVARHVSDVQCVSCHQKIDPFGLALEQYDAVGRRRDHDGTGQVIDVSARLKDGTQFAGFDGLRKYLLTQKKDAVTTVFYRRLLGYALGRSVLISDELLLSQLMQTADCGGVADAVIMIVQSPQFQMVRGAQFEDENSQ